MPGGYLSAGSGIANPGTPFIRATLLDEPHQLEPVLHRLADTLAP